MHNVAFGNFGKDERIYVAFRSLPQGVSGTNCRSGLTPPASAGVAEPARCDERSAASSLDPQKAGVLN